MQGRFTREAKHSLKLAEEEARSLNHHWVGTEHLLLALVRMVEEGASSGGAEALRRSLASSDVDVSTVRRRVVEAVPSESEVESDSALKLTPKMTRILVRAQELATEDSRDLADTEHFLLGMFWEAGGLGDRVLEHMGITSGKLVEYLSSQDVSDSPISPQVVPPPRVEHDYNKTVTVSLEDLGILFRKLPSILPSDAPLAWNISPDGESAWISSVENVALEDSVRQALAE